VTYSTSAGDSIRLATCGGDTMYGGDACSISCEAGFFRSSGPSALTCGTDGNWVGEPECSQNCGALVLDNGSTSGQCGGDVGDSCTMLGCDAGYLPSDASLVNTARECQTDGTWSGTALLCVGIPCTTNTAIAHSDRTASNPCDTGTGDSCSFTCDAGFHVQGVHTCGADGTLSGGSCERNACTGGLTVPDSPTTCSGVFEEACLYTCPSGRSATTPHICGADGVFTGGACTPCSGALQDLLDWLETDSAMFSYCPTADVTIWQGVLTINVGKELFIDGSGGSGGSITFNGVFAGPHIGPADSVTLINVLVVNDQPWDWVLCHGACIPRDDCDAAGAAEECPLG